MSRLTRLLKVTKSISVCGFYFATHRRTKALERLYTDFYGLGGLYIKFLQLLVLRGDLGDIDTGELNDMLAVFDQNQYEPLDVRQTLQSELGDSAQRITLGSEAPIAAGSFGQVYGGRLEDGTKVAIKILRPTVSKYLHFDLRLISLVGRLITMFRPNGFLSLMDVLRDFKRLTISETDYITEARTANQIYQRLADNPVIGIPRTFSQLCTRHVLVQEYVDGVALSELMAKVPAESIRQYVWERFNTNLDYVMEAFAYESLAAVFEDGGAHGDPHPGNIYIRRDNQISLIDFGIVTDKITRKTEMLGMLSEYVAVYAGDFSPERFTLRMMDAFVPKLTRSLYVISRAYGVNLAERVMVLISDIAGQELRSQPSGSETDKMIQNYKILNLFMNVVNHDNRFGITADIESLAFFRSSIMYLHLSDRLCISRETVSRAYQRILIDYGDQRTAYNVNHGIETLDESFHFIANWLDRLHYSDPISYDKIAKAIG
jgi:tRNA A-37 threonylcarbamoyl transferase component Bud32